MPELLVVGGGLFGSLAAVWARRRGIETLVFDAGLNGAASPAAAGLFAEIWAGKKFAEHFHRAVPLLDALYGIRTITLERGDGTTENLHFVPPAAILEPAPIRQEVTAVGDGWLEAGGRRYEGAVYVAAGIWCKRFFSSLEVRAKTGSAFTFRGERQARLRQIARSRQAVLFVRDPGNTYFSDGTAEPEHTPEHDRLSLERAAAMGLTDMPVARHWGHRPYTPGGPLFQRMGSRTWLGTGGRKMGTIVGASFARRLVEEELR